MTRNCRENFGFAELRDEMYVHLLLMQNIACNIGYFELLSGGPKYH